MMDREDMNFPVDEPIDDAVRALDHFTNGGIFGFWNHASGLWEGRQPFNSGNQLLSDKLRIVGRVLCNELLDRLDIFYRPAGPGKRNHLRS